MTRSEYDLLVAGDALADQVMKWISVRVPESDRAYSWDAMELAAVRWREVASVPTVSTGDDAPADDGSRRERRVLRKMAELHIDLLEFALDNGGER